MQRPPNLFCVLIHYRAKLYISSCYYEVCGGVAERVTTCVRTCVLAILDISKYPDSLGLMISITTILTCCKAAAKKKNANIKKSSFIKIS